MSGDNAQQFSQHLCTISFLLLHRLLRTWTSDACHHTCFTYLLATDFSVQSDQAGLELREPPPLPPTHQDVGSKHRTKGRCCHSLSHSPGLWIYLSTLLFIRTNSYWSHFLLRSPCCTKTLTLKDRIHFNQIYGSNIKNKWLHT